MYDTTYDAIVVGAGPAGSTAAAILAKNNMRTLLFDRENFPREKPCGDAIPIKGMQTLYDLGVPHFTPEEAYDIDHVYMKGPYGINTTIKVKIEPTVSSTIISRYVLDQHLFEFAVANGAEFCMQAVTAPIIENGRVVGVRAKSGKQETDYRAKVVIAADGATSAIARALNTTPRADRHKAIALRGYIDSDVDLNHTIELNFLREAQPGYAWFFPVSKRRANIGVGMRADVYKHQDKTLQTLLNDYVTWPEVRSRIGAHKVEEMASWQLPLATDKNQRVIFDGALLVGDAGGFVDPITGAGIYQAIVTGKAAAETIVEAIRANDVSARGLAAYNKRWKAIIGGDMARAKFFHDASSIMPSLIDGFLLLVRALPPLRPLLLGKV